MGSGVFILVLALALKEEYEHLALDKLSTHTSWVNNSLVKIPREGLG